MTSFLKQTLDIGSIYILQFCYCCYGNCSQENSSLVVPWIVGAIAFTSLEAVAMVYSNVLRDHVNRVSWWEMECGYTFINNRGFNSSNGFVNPIFHPILNPMCK